MIVAELPNDYRPTDPENQRTAQSFFDKGRVVADTGSYDYAIEMYLTGFAYDPEAVEAHQALRDISLKRKGQRLQRPWHDGQAESQLPQPRRQAEHDQWGKAHVLRAGQY